MGRGDGLGRVFEPNPVVTLRGQSLRDDKDATGRRCGRRTRGAGKERVRSHDCGAGCPWTLTALLLAIGALALTGTEAGLRAFGDILFVYSAFLVVHPSRHTQWGPQGDSNGI